MISKINNFNVKIDYNTLIKLYKYCYNVKNILCVIGGKSEKNLSKKSQLNKNNYFLFYFFFKDFLFHYINI